MIEPFTFVVPTTSPSSRRAWIEIEQGTFSNGYGASPSSRRAWIEIIFGSFRNNIVEMSPSSRRAWIEITMVAKNSKTSYCRPPHGGRGLKYKINFGNS